jgi:endonuclease/exonuclease/phosphatase family metal-dependent hydrolase
LIGHRIGYDGPVTTNRWTLDVVTINLWGDNGPASRRMDDLCGWLKEEAPDLVLLQEVETVDGRGQAEILAEAVGFDHAETIRTGRGLLPGEGLGILSRHPLVGLPSTKLPKSALDHPRSLQQVEVVAPAATVRVGNTHLAWRLNATPARAKQARAITAAVAAVDGPTLLGGDLNDVPGSETLGVLETAGFTDCCSGIPHPQITFDRGNEFMWQHELAGRRVDHLLARGMAMSEARVVLDGDDGPIVSDHYGVRATLSGG